MNNLGGDEESDDDDDDDDNDNDNDDSDDDSIMGQLFDLSTFTPLTRDSIRIVSELLDDRVSGDSSKKR